MSKTERLGMMGAIGGFGGCFDLSVFQLKEPVLVSGPMAWDEISSGNRSRQTRYNRDRLRSDVCQ